MTIPLLWFFSLRLYIQKDHISSICREEYSNMVHWNKLWHSERGKFHAIEYFVKCQSITRYNTWLNDWIQLKTYFCIVELIDSLLWIFSPSFFFITVVDDKSANTDIIASITATRIMFFCLNGIFGKEMRWFLDLHQDLAPTGQKTCRGSRSVESQ